MATIPSIAMIPSGYKASKVYSVLPTDGAGDLTFSRAGALPSFNATRVNSDGLIEQVLSNVPRLDYSDGVCPSLLIEPQSTNLATYSEDFSDASWTKVSCSITANSTTSPDGTTTADLLTSDNIGSFGRIQKTLSASGTVTFSLFVKQNTANLVTLYLTGLGIGAELGTNLIYDFNFTTNTLVKNASSSSTATSTKVENFSNNWKRISVTVSSTTITDVRVYSNWATINSFSTYIWGAQLEALPYATSYIPTVASTVTRVAETVSKTGLSDYINSSEGVLYFQSKFLPSITSAIALKGATGNNRVVLGVNSNNTFGMNVVSNGVISTTVTTPSNSNYNKLAVVWNGVNCSLFINGLKIGTSLSDSPIGLSTLIFDNGNSLVPFFGNLKNLQVYTTALSDAQLIALTQ